MAESWPGARGRLVVAGSRTRPQPHTGLPEMPAARWRSSANSLGCTDGAQVGSGRALLGAKLAVASSSGSAGKIAKQPFVVGWRRSERLGDPRGAPLEECLQQQDQEHEGVVRTSLSWTRTRTRTTTQGHPAHEGVTAIVAPAVGTAQGGQAASGARSHQGNQRSRTVPDIQVTDTLGVTREAHEPGPKPGTRARRPWGSQSSIDPCRLTRTLPRTGCGYQSLKRMTSIQPELLVTGASTAASVIGNAVIGPLAPCQGPGHARGTDPPPVSIGSITVDGSGDRGRA